jgi:hypothetical protein
MFFGTSSPIKPHASKFSVIKNNFQYASIGIARNIPAIPASAPQ